MPELIKRINSGWVLMDSMSLPDGRKAFWLERGRKAKCMIELESDGHGWLYTQSDCKRI